MSLKLKIGVSILSSDLSNLKNECSRIIESGSDFIHIDIMDGHFVDNLTFGPPVIKSIRKNNDYLLDCHLMVSEPDKWIIPIYESGGNIFTFHIESTDNPLNIIKKVKELKMKCGIAISPETKIESILYLIDKIDLVLIMTVKPGFGGQIILEETFHKISNLRKLYPNLDIEIDGGINKNNIKKLKSLGANMIVSGSDLLKGDLEKNINFYRTI